MIYTLFTSRLFFINFLIIVNVLIITIFCCSKVPDSLFNVFFTYSKRYREVFFFCSILKCNSQVDPKKAMKIVKRSANTTADTVAGQHDGTMWQLPHQKVMFPPYLSTKIYLSIWFTLTSWQAEKTSKLIVTNWKLYLKTSTIRLYL